MFSYTMKKKIGALYVEDGKKHGELMLKIILNTIQDIKQNTLYIELEVTFKLFQ
jgi:hypothetical protein